MWRNPHLLLTPNGQPRAAVLHPGSTAGNSTPFCGGADAGVWLVRCCIIKFKVQGKRAETRLRGKVRKILTKESKIPRLSQSGGRCYHKASIVSGATCALKNSRFKVEPSAESHVVILSEAKDLVFSGTYDIFRRHQVKNAQVLLS